MLSFSEQLAADPIKGVVRDSTGEPLSGATVMNKRIKRSVQTNDKGEFSIEGKTVTSLYSAIQDSRAGMLNLPGYYSSGNS